MTDSRRWKRIDAILDELLELGPEDRKARMEELSGDDAELRPDLERLLAADTDSAAGILDRGVAPLADHVLDSPPDVFTPPGQRIGPYRVERELGRGGMGEVLLAERADGDFDQRVALKILRGGLDRADIVERFRRERRILAALRHPNIAALHDGGATADGTPYFAMEYVEGERITDWCDARRLGLPERVKLFESVCLAVEYAHRNLVVHRDIKPGNVFVTSDGTVKLLDFGIAKLLDTEATDETQPTRGFLTPAFAAPEQIRGEGTSTASDVFSLGMLLYVLLAGRHPHGDTSRSIDIARAITEDDPPEPSSMSGRDDTTRTAGEIAGLRGLQPSELRGQLKGDLDNIISKALRKSPEERYSSVRELREDLERYRTSIPVLARRATTGYRVRKFVRRHKVGTIASAGVLLAVIVGIGGVLWQARIAARERDRAQAVKDYLIEIFSAVDPAFESGETLTAVDLVERGAQRVAGRFENDPEIRAEVTRVLGTVLTSLARYERAKVTLSEALEQQRRLDDPASLHEALLRLGDCVLALSENERALELYTEAEALARRRFGPSSPGALLAAKKVAVALQNLGRLEEAEAVYRDVLRAAERAWPNRGELVAPYHEGLAELLAALGRPEAAEPEQRAAVEAYRAAGVDGVPLSVALGTLGSILGKLDRKEEAEQMLRESVSVLRQEYGVEGHPQLAMALSDLAGPLMQSDVSEASGRERLDEAEGYLREAVDMLERHLGPDHWKVGHYYSNLSVVKTKQGDIPAAGELLERSVALIRKALGERHPMVAAPLSNLARNLLRQKRYAESESLYVEAIAVARECFGTGSVYVSHPVFGFADLCFESGRYGDAEKAALEAWKLRHDALGAENSLVVETRVRIAAIQAAAGRRTEALAVLDGAIEEARRGLPETTVVLASALLERAKQGRAAGHRRAGIEPYLTEALNIRREQLGEDDERTAEVRNELAGVRSRP